MWLKIRLAPMCPWFGTVSLAFVGPPTIKVQLLPYNRVRLMKIPVLQVRALVKSLLLAFSLNCLAAVNVVWASSHDMSFDHGSVGM